MSTTQYEAVIETMRKNGGFATLGWLYQEALKVSDVSWGTKTPFKSINRIVQNPKYFFRIRPGLWALNELKGKLPAAIEGRDEAVLGHTYYQGLLVQIGNLRKQDTFVPAQDRRKKFINTALGDIISTKTVYPFSYDNLVRKAAHVDVIWFNERHLPGHFFEVENYTDFNSSLLKFLYFQDFNIDFRIVAPEKRRGEFEKRIGNPAFDPIRQRIKFTKYETVSDLHTKEHELAIVKSQWLQG